MRKLCFYIILILFFLVASYRIAPKILKEIGSFLVVHDKFESVDYVISNRFSPMVLDYLRTKKAKFIILTITEDTNRTWQAYHDIKNVINLRKEADKFGLPQEKVLIYKKTNDEVWEWVLFYKQVLIQLEAKSALFIDQFYHTRTLRFFLNMHFDEIYIKTYVQHDNSIEVEDDVQWWEKTTYANLFIEEYLTMGFYYLNKFLWTGKFY